MYDKAKSIATVIFELSEEFVVEVGMHQGSMCVPFLLADAVDVVTVLATFA